KQAVAFDDDGLRQFLSRNVRQGSNPLGGVGDRVRDHHVLDVVLVEKLLESVDRHNDLLMAYALRRSLCERPSDGCGRVAAHPGTRRGQTWVKASQVKRNARNSRPLQVSATCPPSQRMSSLSSRNCNHC